jgi:hypothetical protein
VLLIPLLLVLVAPVVVIAAVNLWRWRYNVFFRFYCLLQVGYSLGTLALLAWTGLLWAWVRAVF